jgi:hypothetical protein
MRKAIEFLESLKGKVRGRFVKLNCALSEFYQSSIKDRETVSDAVLGFISTSSSIALN